MSAPGLLEIAGVLAAYRITVLDGDAIDSAAYGPCLAVMIAEPLVDMGGKPVVTWAGEILAQLGYRVTRAPHGSVYSLYVANPPISDPAPGGHGPIVSIGGAA